MKAKEPSTLKKASDESTWHSRNLQKLFIHGAHAFYTEKE